MANTKHKPGRIGQSSAFSESVVEQLAILPYLNDSVQNDIETVSTVTIVVAQRRFLETHFR